LARERRAGAGAVSHVAVFYGAIIAKSRLMLRRAFIVLALVLPAASPAWAQKTDIVTLQNGDRMTGDIKGLSRGKLELETNDAGTIAFEWDKIVRLQSTRQFEVEVSAGDRVIGTLGGQTERILTVLTGQGAVPLPMHEVVRITELGASFLSRLDGSISAGFSFSKSSGIAQTTLSSENVLRRPASEVRLGGAATITQQSDEEDEDDDRATLGLSYIRYRGKRWFYSVAAGLESNQSLGLVLRSQAGGAVGQRLLNTNQSSFDVAAGAVVNNEKGVDTETTQTVEGLLGARFSFYKYDRPKTNVDATIKYFPSLSQWGRQRVQVDAYLKREFVKDLFFSLSLYYTFDSDPPKAGAQRTDVGIVTSLGWSF
jgi:hypothetical protein